jgi:hypothetical protein
MMRALGIGAVALLLLPAAAAAKSGIELSGTPDGLRAGQPWVVELWGRGERGPARLPRVATLGVEIENLGTGATHVFHARPIRGGGYRATVVFPTRGRWRYQVAGFDPPGGQRWDPVAIGPAADAGRPPEDGGGFPWGWIAAAAPILLAVGLFFARRRTPADARQSGVGARCWSRFRRQRAG